MTRRGARRWTPSASSLLVLLLRSAALLSAPSEGRPFRGTAAEPPSPRSHARARGLPRVRGGGPSSPYEANPNYQGFRRDDGITTLGDLEGYQQPGGQLQRRDAVRREGYESSLHEYHNFGSASSASRRPRPLTEVIAEFFANLHRLSPTLYYGSLSSIGMFLLWQVPPLSPILQRHFVCSRQNTLRRPHSLALSALSHASPTHLFMNLYGLFMFGPHVARSVSSAGLPLWPFALGAALSASATFLALSPRGASCVGLSGITLAMLAFYARSYPSRELGFLVRFVPVRLPAEYALITILALTVLGVLTASRDGVAHGAHLGGLLFGAGYHELLAGGWLTHRRPWYLRWDSLRRTVGAAIKL